MYEGSASLTTCTGRFTLMKCEVSHPRYAANSCGPEEQFCREHLFLVQVRLAFCSFWFCHLLLIRRLVCADLIRVEKNASPAGYFLH